MIELKESEGILASGQSQVRIRGAHTDLVADLVGDGMAEVEVDGRAAREGRIADDDTVVGRSGRVGPREGGVAKQIGDGGSVESNGIDVEVGLAALAQRRLHGGLVRGRGTSRVEPVDVGRAVGAGEGELVARAGVCLVEDSELVGNLGVPVRSSEIIALVRCSRCSRNSALGSCGSRLHNVEIHLDSLRSKRFGRSRRSDLVLSEMRLEHGHLRHRGSGSASAGCDGGVADRKSLDGRGGSEEDGGEGAEHGWQKPGGRAARAGCLELIARHWDPLIRT